MMNETQLNIEIGTGSRLTFLSHWVHTYIMIQSSEA